VFYPTRDIILETGSTSGYRTLLTQWQYLRPDCPGEEAQQQVAVAVHRQCDDSAQLVADIRPTETR
jgi:hypothetical protein